MCGPRSARPLHGRWGQVNTRWPVCMGSGRSGEVPIRGEQGRKAMSGPLRRNSQSLVGREGGEWKAGQEACGHLAGTRSAHWRMSVASTVCMEIGVCYITDTEHNFVTLALSEPLTQQQNGAPTRFFRAHCKTLSYDHQWQSSRG